MLRYAITSGLALPSPTALLEDARRWAAEGVDFVQLREKTMDAGPLTELATAMAAIFRAQGGRSKLLINGRADVAVASGADGVHLTSRREELTSAQVQQVFAGSGRKAIVSVSCHDLDAVRRASVAGTDIVLFGPVFGKQVEGEDIAAGVGLQRLQEACMAAAPTPVLALGGVTFGAAESCMRASAKGVAGIRLFSDGPRDR